MKQTRKAQVAIFFLLGLVLVAAILFLIYAMNRVSVNDDDPISTSESEQYLSQCLETAFYHELDALAEGEFGSESRQVRWKEVALGIDGSDSISNTNGMTLDDDDTLIKLLERNTNNNFESTWFGKITLQKLCDPEGPNAKSQNVQPQCSSPVYGPDSLQETMAESLSEAVDTCKSYQEDSPVDFSTYGEATVTITYGAHSTTLTTIFSENDLVLEQTFNVRLLTLYNYVYERLLENTKNPTMLINNSYPDSEYYRREFVAERDILPELTQFTFTDTNAEYSYQGTNLAIRFIVDERGIFTDKDGAQYDPDGFTRP